MRPGRELVVASLLVGACSGGGNGNLTPIDAATSDAVRVDARPSVDYLVPTVPLMDMLDASYKGFEGGLYPGRSNEPPAAHASAGRARAASIRPRDLQGNPSATGKYVLMSIGMSNATQEWCSGGGAPPCSRQSLMAKAAADPQVEHGEMALVNGALGSQVCTTWDEPTDPNWDRVRGVLQAQGLTEAQVQAIWLKCAEPQPTTALPSAMSHAYQVERAIGGILRTARQRYPNLQLVFISDRIYAGYATTALNPEPHAYETGFAVKWVIEAQIQQRSTGTIDPVAGDLGSPVAPWIGWGPDLWANGATPRSDGLTYVPGDYAADGTHPGATGQDKVSNLLLRFFKTSPFTSCWFLANQSCAM